VAVSLALTALRLTHDLPEALAVSDSHSHGGLCIAQHSALYTMAGP
jgi:hypothetical protein